MKKKDHACRVIAFFISFIIILSSLFSSFGINAYASINDATVSEKYYRIKVFAGSADEEQELSLMVVNGNVYAEATELAAIMGFNSSIKDDVIGITNKDDKNLPVLYCLFYNGKKTVYRRVVNEKGEYEASYDSIININGGWIPFEYSVYLLNSSILILDDGIYIERPHKKAIDLILDEMSNRGNYYHPFYNPDYHAEMQTMSDASRVVNVFDGLLSFDPDSWLEYFQAFFGLSSAYNTKYGKEVALLICTMSEKESSAISDDFKSTSESFNTGSDTLTEFTSILREHLASLNKSESLAEINWISTLANKNNSLASADDAYKYLLSAQHNRDLANLLGEDAALDVYDTVNLDINGISFELADYIKIIGGVLEGISYMSQFQAQDSFTTDALDTILEEKKWREWSFPSSVVEGMKSTIDDLKSNIVKYSMFLYVRNNLLNTAKDVVNLRQLIGGVASAELVLWNLGKKILPFFREGLNATHNFELASYAYVFQSDMLNFYKQKRNLVLNADTIQSVTAEDLWPVIQYLYIYLKSAYVTREADIESFTNDDQKKHAQYIQELKTKNNIVANALDILKKGTKDNQYYSTFGILPSENSKFLSELNDDLILDFIEEHKIAEGLAIHEEEIYKEYVAGTVIPQIGASNMKTFTATMSPQVFDTDWGNRNGLFAMDIRDLNNDGIKELLLYICKPCEVNNGYRHFESNNGFVVDVYSINDKNDIYKVCEETLGYYGGTLDIIFGGGYLSINGELNLLVEYMDYGLLANGIGYEVDLYKFDSNACIHLDKRIFTPGGSSDIRFICQSYDGSNSTEEVFWADQDYVYNYDDNNVTLSAPDYTVMDGFDYIYSKIGIKCPAKSTVKGYEWLPSFLDDTESIDPIFRIDNHGTHYEANYGEPHFGEINYIGDAHSWYNDEFDTSATFIIPDSSDRLITDVVLQNFDAQKLELARNEIFARHGRKFKTDYIQDYFDSKAWYRGTVEPDDFDSDVFNDIEKENVNFILNYEGKGEQNKESTEEEDVYNYVISRLHGLWYRNTMGPDGPWGKMLCEGNNFDGEIKEILEYHEGYLVRIDGGYSYYFGKDLDSCVFIDGWVTTNDNQYGTSGWWKPDEEMRKRYGD